MNVSWGDWERAIVDLLFPSFPGISSCTSGCNQTDSGFAAGLPFLSSCTWARGSQCCLAPKASLCLSKAWSLFFMSLEVSSTCLCLHPDGCLPTPLLPQDFCTTARLKPLPYCPPAPTVPVCKVCFLLEKTCPQRDRINLNDFTLSLIDLSSDNERKGCSGFHLWNASPLQPNST